MVTGGRIERPFDDDGGAVVVEFAVVFILFVVLLAGLIQYGAIFMTQQSLTHAAAEGTRAAVDVIDDADAETRARAVVADQLDWLDPAGLTVGPSPMVQSCDTAIYPAGTECLVVDITFDWAGHRIVPTMIGVATPDTMTARAVIVR